MKVSWIKTTLLAFCCLFMFTTLTLEAQTKEIKRPSNTVGIKSVDTFVSESFSIYDKVYMYDGYAASGKELEDEDIDVLEAAIDNVTELLESAPDILSDLEGRSVLKQSKCVLRINKAKKALKYSIKTAKNLMLGKKEKNE